ncbi:MAG: helix-turn-helix domain-containing protein [Comamonas sp.]|nr:helix-turn-helix domain-containing protein [Comamonas sp.]
MSKETISAAEVAELLNCTEEQAEELTRKGEIPGTKFGKSWVYVRLDLLAYVAERARREAEQRRSQRGGRAGTHKVTPLKPRRKTPPALPQLATT